MNAELLSTLSVIFFAASGVFLIVSVFLWFFLGIPKVLSDLSGRTARKTIESMRAGNEKSGKKSYRPSAVNQKRGTITESIPKPPPETQTLPLISNETMPLENDGTLPLFKTEETTALLNESPVTSTLDTDLYTKEAFTAAPETGLLEVQITESLEESEQTDILPAKMKMIEEILFVHTNETL